MNTPDDLKYTEAHEWVKQESDGTVTVGITDHAQDQLGDVVFVQSPETGRRVTKGEECGVIESVKAVADLFGPISGRVAEVNALLADQPGAKPTVMLREPAALQ